MQKDYIVTSSGSINSLYIQTGKKICAHLVCMVNRNLILPDLQVSLIQPSRGMVPKASDYQTRSTN